jgi:hypothetical protein
MDKQAHRDDDQQGKYREASNRAQAEAGAEQDDELTHRRERVTRSHTALTQRENEERWPIG